ncbi:hypothetical protein EB001_11235 [bacterium]|nr:hypothetical protein [bacterium]
MIRLVLLVALCFCSSVGYSQNIVYSQGKYYSYSSYQPSTSSAQGVAEIQARRNSMGHCGGNNGYEGVGFSSVSSDAAIRNCCYWGQKTPVEIGVAKGRSGWYACVRYR